MGDFIQKAPRLELAGKYFSRKGERLYLQAMRLTSPGTPSDFTAKVALRTRLLDLRRANTNALLVPCADADPLLDLAAAAGLFTLVELPLSIPSLLAQSTFPAILTDLAALIGRFRNHPGLIGFLIDPGAVTEITDPRKEARFARRLTQLLRTLKRNSRDFPIAFRHRAETWTAASPEEDFIWGRMPAPAPRELDARIAALNNIAQARPLVVEFDNAADNEPQITAAYAGGAAGILASSRQAQKPAGLPQLKCLDEPSEIPPFRAFSKGGPSLPADPPLVSIVVCATGAPVMVERCLESLTALSYPRIEVVLVHNGSPAIEAVARHFPGIRAISDRHRGLARSFARGRAAARNSGMRAARGEIVAFTESDCAPDKDWLTLLVGTMIATGRDVCGGPVFAQPEASRIAACVAAASAAPPAILFGDQRAEYIVARNLAFRREALARLGGFDCRLNAAGDDVDICWRAAEAGLTVGYCPSAAVWRGPEPSPAAYLRGQFERGQGEAMLCEKHPERADLLGRIVWHGVIAPPGRRPGTAAPISGERPRRMQEMVQSPEWNALALAALGASIAAGITVLPALMMFAASLLPALAYGWRAKLTPACRGGPVCRLLVSCLAYIGPLARGFGRLRYGLGRTAARLAFYRRPDSRHEHGFEPPAARWKTSPGAAHEPRV